ncbi:hypothetical protein SCAR479_00393 [Seiridium cardinale]|uniref:Uncharacterized protein n=1 Tax=Seiridium cardinale TaxID=138064 RepID=A0ABR2Y9D6_9PEZI
MRLSFLGLSLAALASAAPSDDGAVEARALTCANLGPLVTDNFDDRTVLPVSPEVSTLLSPTPNGTYINYTQAAYANIGSLTNQEIPSKPNDIYILPNTNKAILKPAFHRANAFGLKSFRYVCLTRSFETIITLPAKCTFTVSCNNWGAAGPASRTTSQTFTFDPISLVDFEFETAVFKPTFKYLSQCSIKVNSGKPAGLPLPSGLSKPLTILAIDDVVNRGQLCTL